MLHCKVNCGTVAFGLNNKADGLSFACFSSISRHLGNPLWDLVKYSTLAGVPQTFNALSTILRKWLSIYKYLSFLSPFCAQSLSFAAEISSHKIISQIPISFISFNSYIYSPMLFFSTEGRELESGLACISFQKFSDGQNISPRGWLGAFLS